MIKKTYINKSNTIIKGSKENLGLNPIASLNCGGMTSRFLIDFNIDEIKNIVLENSCGEENAFTHKLHIYNCGSFDKNTNIFIPNGILSNDEKKRNVSFDIVIFRIHKSWDSGVGYDSSSDFWVSGEGVVSEKASSWFNATSDIQWESEGIYDNETLLNEIEKFNNNEESIIVAIQHFDRGNEDVDVDITNYINNIINSNKEHNGLCVALAPNSEEKEETTIYYTNFFNNNTNTFFKPFVITKKNKAIIDDRYNFILGRENKLLLYSQIGGVLTNLDELPICTIDGDEYPVKMIKKGVYEATVKLDETQYSQDDIVNDMWGNIKINGETFDDIEMEFVVMGKNKHFNIGTINDVSNKYTAIVQGVNDNEVIHYDEERQVKVYFKRNYSYNDYKLVNNAQYRIYVNDGQRELDVIEWDDINIYSDYNTFSLCANDFLPNVYKVDIKAQIENEIKVYRNVLTFEIKNNITNSKH